MHSGRGRAHMNLHLVGRTCSAGYVEDTVQWAAEDTDSQSYSTSDSE